MLTVYIASPYTQGDQALNVRASIEAADRLAVLGYLPFAPLLSHLWHMIIPHPYEFWMEMDKWWVMYSDVLLRLPGKSKGADAEVALALDIDVPVVHSIDELLDKYPPVDDDQTPETLLGRYRRLKIERDSLVDVLAGMVERNCIAPGKVGFSDYGIPAHAAAIRTLLAAGRMRHTQTGYEFCK